MTVLCRLPVNIAFTPLTDKEINFNVICEVRRKTLPLTLNVKAEGYTMSCLLVCEDSTGRRVDLTDQGVNEINFGEVCTLDVEMKSNHVINTVTFIHAQWQTCSKF